MYVRTDNSKLSPVWTAESCPGWQSGVYRALVERNGVGSHDECFSYQKT